MENTRCKKPGVRGREFFSSSLSLLAEDPQGVEKVGMGFTRKRESGGGRGGRAEGKNEEERKGNETSLPRELRRNHGDR